MTAQAASPSAMQEVTYTAAPAPVTTSSFSWGDFADTLVKGATTVAAAKFLSTAPSGQQVASAASTPTGSLTITPASESGISMPVILAGGALALGLVLILALRK